MQQLEVKLRMFYKSTKKQSCVYELLDCYNVFFWA